MTTRRVCVRWGGGGLLQRSKRGFFVSLEGARHVQTPGMGLRIGIGKSFQLTGAAARLQIPRIKEGGRAATWRSQQRHVFADMHVIWYFSRPPSEMEVLHFRQHLLKPTERRQWLDVDTCRRTLSLCSTGWEAPANELYFQHTVFPPESNDSTLRAASCKLLILLDDVWSCLWLPVTVRS